MAVRTSRRVSPQLRRKRVWARNDEIVTPVAAGSPFRLDADFNTLMGVSHLPVGVTVGGILLDFSLVQTSARASSTDGVTLGIGVFEEETTAQVQTPAVNMHDDWMWWQWIGAPGAATGAQHDTFEVLGGPIRIRAKRRIEELGSNLWCIPQTSGGTTYDMRIRTSTLMLMP